MISASKKRRKRRRKPARCPKGKVRKPASKRGKRAAKRGKPARCVAKRKPKPRPKPKPPVKPPVAKPPVPRPPAPVPGPRIDPPTPVHTGGFGFREAERLLWRAGCMSTPDNARLSEDAKLIGRLTPPARRSTPPANQGN